uniref:Uncharacterized protein n=1 Tax=Aegilops tauschii subsp. strangulata TaxID=200361 RepID=A0A453DKF2_AEGTS
MVKGVRFYVCPQGHGAIVQPEKVKHYLTVYYMSPFATMTLALPAILLEGGVVINLFYTHDPIFSMLIIILGSGVLNFSIFDVICSTTGCPSMLLAIFKS